MGLPPRVRRYSPTRLKREPVTIPTPAGPIIVTVEPHCEQYRVRIETPSGETPLDSTPPAPQQLPVAEPSRG